MKPKTLKLQTCHNMEIVIEVIQTKDRVVVQIANAELVGEALRSVWFELSDLDDNGMATTKLIATVSGRASDTASLPMMRYLRGVIGPALLIGYRDVGYDIQTPKAAIDLAKVHLGFMTEDGSPKSFKEVNPSVIRRFITAAKRLLVTEFFINLDED